MATCISVFKCLCLCLHVDLKQETGGEKNNFSRFCVRRPQGDRRMRGVRPQTEKQKKFELFKHPAVTSTVANEQWSKMDSVIHAYTYMFIIDVNKGTSVFIWLTYAVLVCAQNRM